jgi:ankyrin repeat protein
MTDIGEWAESRRLKIEQQLNDLMTMIETNNTVAFKRRTPMPIAQVNSSVRGRRVLVHAVYYNRLEMTRALLTAGANPNLNDSRGLPIFVAVSRDPVDIDMLKLLLRSGADATVIASVLPVAALLKSQSREQLEALQILVDRGRAHAWWPTHVYWTPSSGSDYPVVSALEQNRTETLHFLLARRSAAAHREDTILINYALTRRNLPLLKTFLDAGVSTNNIATHFTLEPAPIFTCLLAKFDAAAFRMLLGAGVDVNATALGGDSPLHVVCRSRRVRLWVVDALLQRGAKINAWNRLRDETPLTVACVADDLSLAVALVMRGASPDAAFVPVDIPTNAPRRVPNISNRARLMLAALGAADEHAPVRDFDLPLLEELLTAIGKEWFHLSRMRVLEICVALQTLALPALVLHFIVVAACGESPMHLLWSVITCVKHYHEKRMGAAESSTTVTRRRVRVPSRRNVAAPAASQ